MTSISALPRKPAPHLAEKSFRICPACPFYCRVEEEIHTCPWSKLPLIAACLCGAVIRDPVLPDCASCGKRLRRDEPRTDVARTALR